MVTMTHGVEAAFGGLRGRRFVVAAGGYRTGSTLQYNLIGAYVELIGVGTRVGYVDPDDLADALARLPVGRDCLYVAKCHHITGDRLAHDRVDAWRELIDTGEAEVVTTRRTTDHVKQSMARMFGIPESSVEASEVWRDFQVNAQAWAVHSRHTSSYQALVGCPALELETMAQRLRLPWSAACAREAAHLSSRSVAASIISALPDGVDLDVTSQLHWGHLSA